MVETHNVDFADENVDGQKIVFFDGELHPYEDVHIGNNYSNVMYIGSSPLCKKNNDYLTIQGERFLKGESAPDFSDENYEVSYLNRATMDDLSDLGKKQMGFVPW